MKDAFPKNAALTVFAVLLVLLVGLALNLGKPCYGSGIRVDIGPHVFIGITQRWPPTIEYTYLWMDGYVWVFNGSVGFVVGTAVLDLQTMRGPSSFTYAAGVNFQLLQQASYGFGIELTALHAPKDDYLEYSIDGVFSSRWVIEGTDVVTQNNFADRFEQLVFSYFLGISWKEGDTFTSLDWSVGFSVSAYLSWTF